MSSAPIRLAASIFVIAVLSAACGGETPVGPPSPTPVPVPSVAGTWTGTYVITACGHSGGYANIKFCQTLSYAPLPLNLVLSQSGSSVSGTLTLGSIPLNVTGTVNSAGHLSLNGTGSWQVDQGVTGTLELQSWDTAASGGRMTGGWNTKYAAPGYVGSAQTVNTLSSVSKL